MDMYPLMQAGPIVLSRTYGRMAAQQIASAI